MTTNREQLAELARLLAETKPEEIDCDVVLERVAAYLEAQQSHGPMQPELEAVAQHLRVCRQCFEEFEALVRSHD